MEERLKQKLSAYKTPPEAVKVISNTAIVFLVGISGAGKDTVRKELLATGDFHHIVSHTTRPPRHNHGVLEQDGVDYHFVDVKKVENMLDNKEFIEAKIFSNNVYGTSIAEIQAVHDAELIAISDLEIQGVAEYMAISPAVKPIFLLPPSYEIWQERLKRRYHDNDIDPIDISRRLQTAKVELQEALEKDYFYFVINNDLETSIQQVEAIANGTLAKESTKEARTLAKDLLAKL